MSTTVICVLLETLPQARHEEVGMQRQQSSSWGTETPWRAWLLRQQLEFLRKSKGEEVSYSEYNPVKNLFSGEAKQKRLYVESSTPKVSFRNRLTEKIKRIK